MPRVRRPAAPTSAATLLALMWLASPALPVGGFSYSEGLEAAVEAGLVHNEASAQAWLLDQLLLGLGRGELAVVAQAIAAWRRGDAPRVRELNDWLLSTRESAELRLQTEQMGRSLGAWLQQRPGTDAAALARLLALPPAPSYPVAFALAAAGTSASVREAVLACAFGWAENMVQAAIKAVPLGQSAGQRMLGALVEAIPETVDAALALRDGERMAFMPMLAVLSARHETQYSRLFRS
ncbi:urease accessory protein UreF [Methylibium sp. Root1272]|uniref:urease accessory protein UreF n=1 Tax=Methylibium sp. Root1272 TaxID=1736441 RepID=UPI0006FE60F6|nr:urease accessory UreF family protein [Methylibium sp. Root1272]KQW65807.1 urease accessory protein UreF [Methylibium sp. Root1272]